MQISKVVSKVVYKEDLAVEVEGYNTPNTLTSISRATKKGKVDGAEGGLLDTYLITVYIRKEKVNV